jgi:uncharacterized protein YraI
MQPCPDCWTHSVNPLNPIGDGVCGECYGGGYESFPLAEEMDLTCVNCDGSGKCPTCDGEGEIEGDDDDEDDDAKDSTESNSDSGGSSYSDSSYSGGGGSSYSGGGGGGYSGGGGGGGGGGSSSLWWLVLPAGIVLGVVIGGCYLGSILVARLSNSGGTETTSSRGSTTGGSSDNRRTARLANGTEVLNKDSNGHGGIMYVNTQTLSVRSGPGTKYPVVRKAYLGDKILVYGQPEIVEGQRWSVSIAENPETRGWVNLKFVSTNQPNPGHSASASVSNNSESAPSSTPEPKPSPTVDPQQRFELLAKRAGYRNIGNEVYEDVKTGRRYSLVLSHDGNGVVGTELRSQVPQNEVPTRPAASFKEEPMPSTPAAQGYKWVRTKGGKWIHAKIM